MNDNPPSACWVSLSGWGHGLSTIDWVDDATMELPRDRLILLTLANGTPLPGRVRSQDHDWVELENNEGIRLVNLAHVAVVDLNTGAPRVEIVDEELPRPRSAEAPRKVTGRAPGRPWTDSDLKDLSEGFLDGLPDKLLADRHGRTFSQVRDLRQAFECQRGNVPDDQLSPAASTWVDRWRRVLRQD